jgi:hypothetical protein
MSPPLKKKIISRLVVVPDWRFHGSLVDVYWAFSVDNQASVAVPSVYHGTVDLGRLF